MIDIKLKRLPHGEGLPLPAYGSDMPPGSTSSPPRA